MVLLQRTVVTGLHSKQRTPILNRLLLESYSLSLVENEHEGLGLPVIIGVAVGGAVGILVMLALVVIIVIIIARKGRAKPCKTTS